MKLTWSNNRVSLLFKLLVIGVLVTSMLGLPGTPAQVQAASSATITVNAGVTQGTLARPEKYMQYTDDKPISAATHGKAAEMGPFEISRVWLDMKKMYNHSTDTYTYNFNYHQGNLYYDYLTRASNESQFLMLNPQKYDTEVLNGTITWNKYKEMIKEGIKHYKQLYPKIKYIEANNEYDLHNISDSNYYLLYKVYYEAVNEVNAELNPTIPLLVGGPITMTFNSTKIQNFISNYASDSNSTKKLDFISYHTYRGTNHNGFANHRSTVNGWLSNHNLNTNIPIFVTEYGAFYNGDSNYGAALEQAVTAAGSANMAYYWMNQQSNVFAIPYDIKGYPGWERGSFITDDDATYTPRAHNLFMDKKMKTTRISATSNAISSGKGVHALASYDSTGLAIKLWNYQWVDTNTEYNTTINISNLPSIFNNQNIRMKVYMVSTTKSNYAHNINKSSLEVIKDEIVTHNGSFSTTVFLDRASVALIELTPTSDTAGGLNFALESKYGGASSGWVNTGQIHDGILHTLATHSSGTEKYIEYHFGSNINIKRFKILETNSGTAQITHWKVQEWSDVTNNWKDVFGWTAASSSSWQTRSVNFTSDKIRLYVRNSNTGGTIAVQQFEAWTQ